MKVREIRELSAEDLSAKISDTRKQIVEMRFQLAMRKLESTAKLRNSKKDLARFLTIQTELEQNNQQDVNAKATATAATAAKKPAEKKTAVKKPAAKKQPAAAAKE
jgi:large subunit ribosomal protein L29